MKTQKVKKKSKKQINNNNGNATTSTTTTTNYIKDVSTTTSNSLSRTISIFSILAVVVSILVVNRDIILPHISYKQMEQEEQQTHDDNNHYTRNDPRPSIEETAPATKENAKKEKRSRSSNQLKLPILDQLFPNNVLDDAYENYPLLVTSTSHYDTDDNIPSSTTTTSSSYPTIRTHLITNTKSIQNRTKFTSKLLTIPNLEQILSIPNLKHGDDFLLAKKIMKASGEEWMGRLPYDTIPVDDIQKHVFYGGFSIIVNKVQRLWSTVAKLSRDIERETFCNYVSCNLYMTPQVTKQQADQDTIRSAFEAHYDWMDVIVVQITGTKLWSVATEPLVRLTTHDLKRKPTIQEVNKYLSSATVGKYNDFLLHPGDVLYIPRGFMHNASTNVLPNSDMHQEQDPSIHLSFGIEHLSDTTWEAFLHHALVYYTNDDPSTKKEIALLGKECSHKKAITWNMFLHYTLSAMARLDILGPQQSNKNKQKVSKRKEQDAYLLRQSVPLHPIWNDIVSSNNTYSTTYTQILSFIQDSLDIKHTTTLLGVLKQNQEMRDNFFIPTVVVPKPASPTFVCNWDKLSTTKYNAKLETFLEYIRTKSIFDKIMEHFVLFLKDKKRLSRKSDDDLLWNVGQSIQY